MFFFIFLLYTQSTRMSVPESWWWVESHSISIFYDFSCFSPTLSPLDSIVFRWVRKKKRKIWKKNYFSSFNTTTQAQKLSFHSLWCLFNFQQTINVQQTQQQQQHQSQSHSHHHQHQQQHQLQLQEQTNWNNCHNCSTDQQKRNEHDEATSKWEKWKKMNDGALHSKYIFLFFLKFAMAKTLSFSFAWKLSNEHELKRMKSSAQVNDY